MSNKNLSSAKIIYVSKDKLHMFPPCISQILMLRDLGCNVYVIAEECDKVAAKLIQDSGADLKILGNMNLKKGVLGRILHWTRFAKVAAKEIKKAFATGDIIWAATEGTAIALTPFLKKRPFVMTTLELYENPFYVKGINQIIRYAKAVVACEKNRGRIMQQWFRIKDFPFVMPNKPYYRTFCEKTEEIKHLENRLSNKKYILYQGTFAKDRSLSSLAEALNYTNEKYTLVVIGSSARCEEDKIIDSLRQIYSDVVYGGFFPAPQHLYITQNAYIGVAFYEPSCLNNMFCAPNKIFEYSQFKIPILGNDIPGLQTTIEKHSAGICVDMNNPHEIAMAIDNIGRNYEDCQKGSARLYESVNNLETTRRLLEKIKFGPA